MSNKVLIIDDEQDLCSLMRKFLLNLGYEVYIAFTLQEGMREAVEIRPDILFIDNNLPDGLGWDKAVELRNLLPKAKINLMSAYSPFPKELANSLVVQFLEKPISLSELRNYL